MAQWPPLRTLVHPSNWNKPDTRDDNDQMVVSRHSSVCYDIINRPPMYETFTVTFIEQPSFPSVDTCEVKWFD